MNFFSTLTFSSIIFFNLIICLHSNASVTPKTESCLNDFIDTFSKTRGYSTTINKKEYNLEGDLVHDEIVQFDYVNSSHALTVTYLNDGSTGIRNSGMKVEYDGKENLKLKLGAPNFFGFFVNTAASIAVPSNMKVYDKLALDDEIFSIKRAGFAFFVQALKIHLPDIKSNKENALLEADEKCFTRYIPISPSTKITTFKNQGDVDKFEEEQGKLAIQLVLENKGEIKNLHEIFNLSKPVNLKTPSHFLKFDLSLDPELKTPSEIKLYYKDKIIGDYEFAKTKLVFN